ncbi:MAG: enoyl-ACP reductase [Cyanobacteria bacterium HKST-UBA06]|nr:enoyl-ACP reductase [Cyanobacteria bacterium HKST-UBA06]MCA9842753.1 enoyl-ACP reductase [Cyanobacteria bacterium HKST-UBA03]
MTTVLEDKPHTPTQADTEYSQALKGLLAGKVGLVTGVANKRSIAWAIAQSLSNAGMRLIFTYQNERFEKKVKELTEDFDNALFYECDVTRDEDIDKLFGQLGNDVDRLDTVVHSIAFADRADLEGQFVNTSRDGFLLAHNISAYSLTALTRAAVPLMEKAGGGSVMTMTYYGSEKVVQNYNVMGVAKASLEASVRYLAEDLGPKNIRVNAISAGPIKTLAASGISGFSKITEHMREKAPMRRNIEASEVGDTALFLASPLSRGMTGEILHVDAGYHIIGF